MLYLINQIVSILLFSCSVMYDSLWAQELQHARFPLLHYLPEFVQTQVPWFDGSFQPSHFLLPIVLLPSIFSSIRVFSSESALLIWWPKYWNFSFKISPPIIIQSWFLLRLTGLISLQSKGLSRDFSNTTAQKHQFFFTQPSLWSSSQIHTWLLEKPVLTTQPFLDKVISLLFNMLSRLVISFCPKSKCLLISWLLSRSTVSLEPKKIKSVIISIFTHLFAMKWWDWMPWS